MKNRNPVPTSERGMAISKLRNSCRVSAVLGRKDMLQLRFLFEVSSGLVVLNGLFSLVPSMANTYVITDRNAMNKT
jgi:hypothetical protein